MQLVRQRGFFFVIAFARTWCFANGRLLKDLVTHLPKKFYHRCWVPLDEPGRRRTYWTYTKQACLSHMGNVTWQIAQGQLEPSVEQRLRKRLQERKVA